MITASVWGRLVGKGFMALGMVLIHGQKHDAHFTEMLQETASV